MPDPSRRSPFYPVLILTATLVLWFGFQTSQLLAERTSLRGLEQNQVPIHDNAQRMRAQLDAIAAGTQRLADSGNPNAKLIVEELRRRGITINPNATTPPPPSVDNASASE